MNCNKKCCALWKDEKKKLEIIWGKQSIRDICKLKIQMEKTSYETG